MSYYPSLNPAAKTDKPSDILGNSDIKFPIFSGKREESVANVTKVKLATTKDEIKRHAALAELFALLTTLDHLEDAYFRELISRDDYSLHCHRLLSKCTQWMDIHGSLISSVEQFATSMELSCSYALKRIAAGEPITETQYRSTEKMNEAMSAMDVGERFITLMDQLKLNIRAVDELFLTLMDLLTYMKKFSALPIDHDSQVKVNKWVEILKSKKASDELDEDASRQFCLDMETAYQGFKSFVGTSSRKK